MKVGLCTVFGIPGSGKTTLCQRLNHELNDSFSIININYDKILLSNKTEFVLFHETLMTNTFEKIQDGAMKFARQQVLLLIDVLIENVLQHGNHFDFNQIKKRSEINEDVWKSFLDNWKISTTKCNQVVFLIDDNFYLSSMRYEVYKLARKYEVGFCEIYVNCSIETAKERNGKRRERDIINNDVIYKMADNMECPNPHKNHWEKYNIEMNSEEAASRVLVMLQEALENPAKMLFQVDEQQQLDSQVVCMKNLIHQTDLILRKCVTRLMADGKKENQDLKCLSKVAVQVKDNILSDLKDGSVVIQNVDLETIENSSKNESCEFFQYIYQLFHVRLKMM